MSSESDSIKAAILRQVVVKDQREERSEVIENHRVAREVPMERAGVPFLMSKLFFSYSVRYHRYKKLFF